ncbi:MAG: fatty acid desaturase [Deltaproteobacteria bacterium]|nr:fatty acid desaturase [Deltaproteobacteria bacterium]
MKNIQTKENIDFDNAKPRWDIIAVFTIITLIPIIGIPVYGLYYDFTPASFIAFGVLLSVSNISITTGYHRLWSHKTFEAHYLVRGILAIVSTISLQNSILKWASDHRRHHGNLDNNFKDPYSAKRGFWFSHIGWMLRDYPSAKVDFSNVKDLQRDKIVMFQHNHYLLFGAGLNIAISLILGLITEHIIEMFLIAGFLRIVVSHHTTFFINSVAHIFGTQPYSKTNTARDNALLSFFTFGEGYHNFHHAFPADYRNGIKFWHWDPTKWTIRLLWLAGLAKNLHITPKQRILTQMELAQKTGQ